MPSFTPSIPCNPLSAFGDLALLFNHPRAATIRATSNCRLWTLERAVLNAIKRNFTEETNKDKHRLLDSVPGLKHLPAHQKSRLVDALVLVSGVWLTH